MCFPSRYYAKCVHGARYQAAPKECHLKVVKRIVRYLIDNTPNFGIWYPKRASFDLVGYSDSDYAGVTPNMRYYPKETRRSHQG